MPNENKYRKWNTTTQRAATALIPVNDDSFRIQIPVKKAMQFAKEGLRSASLLKTKLSLVQIVGISFKCLNTGFIRTLEQRRSLPRVSSSQITTDSNTYSPLKLV